MVTSIRRAIPADQEKLSHLVYFEPRVHRHLDWRSPLDWLGAPEYWVREDDGHITAALACPPDPPGALWLRLFVHTPKISLREAWDSLWQIARQNLGAGQAAAIVLAPWFEETLAQSGFVEADAVITLECSAPFPSAAALPPGLQARRMTFDDLPAVAEVDAQAFAPLWRNSLASLQTAFHLAALAEVLTEAEKIVAYQISTGSAAGVHLARLAVLPSLQRRGAGRALVERLLAWAGQNGTSRVSVNTQGSNRISLALYQKMGFHLTGEDYPVYVYPFPPGRETAMSRPNSVIVNGLVRQALVSAEEVMGANGLHTVLRTCGLERYVNNLPPNDMTPAIQTSDYAKLNQAIEDFYGRAGKGMLRRIGKASFQYGLREQAALLGIAGAAIKLLPEKQRIKFILNGMVNALRKSNPEVDAWVEEEGDTLAYVERSCAICWGRESAAPLCYLYLGSLGEAVLWASGKEHEIVETHCLAKGDAYCRFEIGPAKE